MIAAVGCRHFSRRESSSTLRRMRGYGVIVGAIACLSWGCELQSAAVCSPSEEGCACVANNQCSSGLTCVSGTCFDLSSWFEGGAAGAAGFGTSVLPGVDPSAQQAGSGGALAAGSGAAGLGPAVPPDMVPSGAGGVLAAGSGASGLGAAVPPDMVPSGAGGALAAGSGAGAPASTCTALSGDCTTAPCCGDSVCVLGICAARCKIHSDCTSGCCIAHDAKIATCFDASACVAPAR